MQGTSTLFKISSGLGAVVMLLWLLRVTGTVGPMRTPRAAPAAKAHGHAPLLPPPRYPTMGLDRGIPDYGRVPDFTLTESLGTPVSRESLEGTVWVASFVFTRCAGTCPTTAQQVRVLQDALPEGARLVSISVDPTNDTPEVLATYAKGNGRRVERWWLLTGNAHQIGDLATKGFYLGTKGSLLHSENLALVDGRAHLRGFYDPADPTQRAALLRDMALIMATEAKRKEKAAGRKRPRG